MAIISDFGFQNRKWAEEPIPAYDTDITLEYATVTDEPDVVKLSNKTCPLDLEELVVFRGKTIPKVNTELNIQYPSPVKSGVSYGVQVEAVLGSTSPEDPSFRVDDPIICSIQFRHTRSGSIKSSHVETILERALSDLRKDDGTWRFDDLMRLSLKPISE